MSRPITFMNCEQVETYNWDGPNNGLIKFKVKKSKVGNASLTLEVHVEGISREPIVITEQNVSAMRTGLEIYDLEKAKIGDTMKP